MADVPSGSKPYSTPLWGVCHSCQLGPEWVLVFFFFITSSRMHVRLCLCPSGTAQLSAPCTENEHRPLLADIFQLRSERMGAEGLEEVKGR